MITRQNIYSMILMENNIAELQHMTLNQLTQLQKGIVDYGWGSVNPQNTKELKAISNFLTQVAIQVKKKA